MNDLLNLYKPGQLPDLVGILVKGMAVLPTSIMITAPSSDIVSLSNHIRTVRTNALVAGVINTTGPNAAEIQKNLAKYATIPTFLSSYVVPPARPVTPTSMTPSTTTPPLAINDPVLAPIISYLSTAVNDIVMNIIFLIIKDNTSLKDNTKIIAIRTLILSFISFVNDIPAKLKIPGSLLDPNFGDIGLKLSNAITTTLGVVVQPPGSITFQDMGNLLGLRAPASTDPTIRKTPDTAYLESFKSVSITLTAILNSKSFQQYNTPKNIELIKAIPESLKKLSELGSDPFSLKYLLPISAAVFPVPEPTNTLFNNLNSGNFAANLSQPTTGLLPFFCTSILYRVPLTIVQNQLGWLSSRIGGRAFQTMDQIYLLVTKVVNVIKAHVAIVNTLINIFQVNISKDVAVQGNIRAVNDIFLKSGFKINTVPSARGGRRKKRSVKYRKGKAARRRTRHRRI